MPAALTRRLTIILYSGAKRRYVEDVHLRQGVIYKTLNRIECSHSSCFIKNRDEIFSPTANYYTALFIEVNGLNANANTEVGTLPKMRPKDQTILNFV